MNKQMIFLGISAAIGWMLYSDDEKPEKEIAKPEEKVLTKKAKKGTTTPTETKQEACQDDTIAKTDSDTSD